MKRKRTCWNGMKLNCVAQVPITYKDRCHTSCGNECGNICIRCYNG